MNLNAINVFRPNGALYLVSAGDVAISIEPCLHAAGVIRPVPDACGVKLKGRPYPTQPIFRPHLPDRR